MTLDVSSVSKHFGGVYALRDVSMTCRSGEIVGLIGPNGAGKTTLLNVISSAFPLDKGEVRLDERRIDSSSPRKCAIAGIARTFQNIRLFGRLTVRQNVEVGFTTAQRHRASRLNGLTVDSLLRELDLGPVADRPAMTLPYGQQRRLEIARALALVPEFLLLDEPAARYERCGVDGADLVGARHPRPRGLRHHRDRPRSPLHHDCLRTDQRSPHGRVDRRRRGRAVRAADGRYA